MKGCNLLKQIKAIINNSSSLKKARKLWSELCNCKLKKLEERAKVVKMKDAYEKVIKELQNILDEN